MFLFLFGAAYAAMVFWAVKNTARVRKTTGLSTAKTQLPDLVNTTLLAAQIPALFGAMSHATVVNMTAVLVILAILLAVKAGTEADTR